LLEVVGEVAQTIVPAKTAAGIQLVNTPARKMEYVVVVAHGTAGRATPPKQNPPQSRRLPPPLLPLRAMECHQWRLVN